jgi:hypothetical protein
MSPTRKPARWGPIRSLLCLSPLLLFVPWFSVRQYYLDGKPHHLPSLYLSPAYFPLALPVPVTEL